MNQIELLYQEIIHQFPFTRAKLDSPRDPNGHWFLDVVFKNKLITVEWRPNQGFGVSDCLDGENCVYGEGPDKIFHSRKDTLDEIIRLLNLPTE